MEKSEIYNLNDEQLKPMLATGPILVTAGAGSGKTRLLTHRIAYLIKEKGVSEYNILAITFTNKAANEMKERVAKMLGGETSVWISTFHALCSRILRQHIKDLPSSKFDRNFTIYNDDDRVKMLKEVTKERFPLLSAKDVEELYKKVGEALSLMKNEDLSFDEYKALNIYDPSITDITNLMIDYQNKLEQSNSLDFDDLIALTIKLLRTNLKVKLEYNERFKYIHIDEFQDTNTAQYHLVKLLNNAQDNVFVVGDEDQCIYGWRGANIKNISNFIKEFKNTQIFKLERNYRSTKSIIEKANELIKHNTERIDKKLWTDNIQGENVVLKNFSDDKDESTYVIKTIRDYVGKGSNYSDFAILLRLNALSRNFEENLANYGIPYRIYGAFKFYDRAEVKDALAYLKLIANPRDSASFLRVINVPKRGIGDTTTDKLMKLSADNLCSLMETIPLTEFNTDFNSSTRQKLCDFYNLISMMRKNIASLGLFDFSKYVFETVNFKAIYSSGTEEDQNKLLNIDSLLQSILGYEKANANATLETYLENVSLISDIDSYSKDDNAVTLATIHSVKGLEFNNVFIVGLEKKIFPIMRDCEPCDMEEERRLMYVALTRAKERCFLSYCSRRFRYGRYEDMEPSNFITEIGLTTQNLKKNNENSNSYYQNKNFNSYYHGYNDDNNDNDFSQIGYNSSEDYTLPKYESNNTSLSSISSRNNAFDKKITKSDYKVGDKVIHKTYGEGIIQSISGEGINKMVAVNFDKIGMKNLLLEYAPLTKV
jgi:DNA helicase II / ATP-dependent DNA helicase PcrA